MPQNYTYPTKTKADSLTVVPNYGQELTNRNKTNFIISFKYKLHNKFNFDKMDINNLKQFQNFLDKVSKMTFNQVDKEFLCTNDKKDTFKGIQIIHYVVNKKFRIHGIIEDGRFKVLRMDPNHDVHN